MCKQLWKKNARKFLAMIQPYFKISNKMSHIRVLMYHNIEKIPSNSFSVSAEEFEQQVKYLKDNYKIISVDELHVFLYEKGILNDNYIAITIDDGYRCFYENAYPIIKKHAIPCCVFMQTGFIDNEDKEFLSSNEIKNMRKEGIVFGVHTRNHRVLSKLSKNEMESEIKGSKEDLEKILGEKVEYFAYPYGLKRHYNLQTKEIVKDAGYKCAFTAINGVNLPGCDMFELKRTKIERGDSFNSFKRIVDGALDVWGIVDSI